MVDTEEDILIKLARLESEYNKTREILYNQVQVYFRQAISSNYIDEKELIKLIKKCVSTKKQYNDIRHEMMTR